MPFLLDGSDSYTIVSHSQSENSLIVLFKKKLKVPYSQS